MRSDVHSAALRAATKVAFSVAFVSGCSAPAGPGARGAADEEPAETGESELGAPRADASTTACHKDASAKDASATPSTPKPLTCEQVVNAAFPVEGDYPGAKQAVSAEAQTCCLELLEKSQGVLAAHRWDCCANLPVDAGQSAGIACTPWGPPVPPAMLRRPAPAIALAVEVA